MEDEIKKVLIENLFACTESKELTKDRIIEIASEIVPFVVKLVNEQLVKEAVDVEISDNGCAKGLQFIPVWPFTDEYVGGDKVKVIIVKE